MGQGGDLCSIISKAHIPEFYLIVPRHLGMFRCRQGRRVHYWLNAAQSGVGNIMPEAANMILASAVEMIAENTA